MSDALSLRSIKKVYGDKTVLDDMSFAIKEGSVTGLLGPNGAGKTTLIEIIMGLRRSSSGEVVIDGQSIAQRVSARAKIGLVPQELAIHGRLTVIENLKYAARMYGLSGDELKKRVTALVDRFDLTKDGKTQAGQLSGGQKRRLNFALADIHEPRIMILDEPTVGLDPKSRMVVWDIIRDFKRLGKTVILTTHYMEEADSLCDMIIMIDLGKVVATGTPSELKEHLSSSVSLVYTLETDLSQEVVDGLMDLEGVVSVVREPWLFKLLVKSSAEVDTRKHIDEMGLPISGFKVDKTTLEDVFLSLTGKQLKELV